MDLKKWFMDEDYHRDAAVGTGQIWKRDADGKFINEVLELHSSGTQKVVITGIDVNFFSLMIFMARLMIAAVPAMIMAAITVAFLYAMFSPVILAFLHL